MQLKKNLTFYTHAIGEFPRWQDPTHAAECNITNLSVKVSFRKLFVKDSIWSILHQQDYAGKLSQAYPGRYSEAAAAVV